jgi:gamma-butyrobetaine dioxygenase
VLIDGLCVAEKLKEFDAAAFELLSVWPFPYHHTDAQTAVKSTKRVFELGPDGQVEAVHFNNDDRGPALEMPDLRGALAQAQALLAPAKGSGAEPADRAAAPLQLKPVFTDPALAFPAVYAALSALQMQLADEQLRLRLQLRPGTLLIFNNTRVLHARTGFASSSNRVLLGAYIGKDEAEAALRREMLAVAKRVRPVGV